MKWLRLTLQILLPVIVLGGGYWLATGILANKQQPTVSADTFVGPLVNTHVAAAEDIRIDVRTQGTVEPHREIDLSAQVGGRVITVSPALRAGGFFAAGELLLEIDRADYELAVVQQEAAVARAELRALQEKAEAEAAQRAWQELEGNRQADPLVRRQPQIVDAEKSLAAAQALLVRSRLDLERTRIVAPFAGRVRSAKVDIGQIVRPGQPLGRLYGTAKAEVRLPLPASEAAFLQLPLRWADSTSAIVGPQVELTATFAGQSYTYAGKILRTEGEIDRKSRQLTLVAGVDEPYARGEDGARPPLAIGTFVEAVIRGRLLRDIIALPRSALRGEADIWIVDAEHRLRRRTVEVVRVEPERVLVASGIEEGEVVCTSALSVTVDGMPVRLSEQQR